jgi:hypothetical protein
MTHSELIRLVTKMRTTQKEYFATRSKSVLGEAKMLERQVDEAIALLAKEEVDNREH